MLSWCYSFHGVTACFQCLRAADHNETGFFVRLLLKGIGQSRLNDHFSSAYPRVICSQCAVRRFRREEEHVHLLKACTEVKTTAYVLAGTLLLTHVYTRMYTCIQTWVQSQSRALRTSGTTRLQCGAASSCTCLWRPRRPMPPGWSAWSGRSLHLKCT